MNNFSFQHASGSVSMMDFEEARKVWWELADVLDKYDVIPTTVEIDNRSVFLDEEQMVALYNELDEFIEPFIVASLMESNFLAH